jgi:hypothetical protein
MKKIIMAVAVMTLISGVTFAAGFTAPTSDQIQAVLANPASLGGLLSGATAEQAAAVLLQSITAADASTLSEDQKKQVVAMVVARATKAMGSQSNAMVASLAASVSDKWYSTVIAAAITASNNRQATLAAILASVGADSAKGKAAIAAAANPQGVLGIQLYTSVHSVAQSLGGASLGGPLGGVIGAGLQTARPNATVVAGETAVLTPPVPPPYKGQQ